MKKLLVLLFALFTSFSVFAQNKQDAGIQGDLSDEQVIEKLTRNEILPLYVNSFLSFDNASNKEKIGKLAQKQVVKHRNYVAYYNAAVVYFVSDEFLGFDTSRSLSENDIANVVKYATKAIELSGKNPCPNMYLLRAEAKMKKHDLFGFFGPYMEEEPEVSWARENKALAREILKDLEKVEVGTGTEKIKNLNTFGPKNSTELISTISSVVAVSKIIAPVLLITSLLIAFIWIFFGGL